MLNAALKDAVTARVLSTVLAPAQYVGGELNSQPKDHRTARGTLCLAFPDTYAMGMSHHGLQVLYSLMNTRDDWACERAFAPLPDCEAKLGALGLPLYGLETFTPLHRFDVLGFTLQYEISSSNRACEGAPSPKRPARCAPRRPLRSVASNGPGGAPLPGALRPSPW